MPNGVPHRIFSSFSKIREKFYVAVAITDMPEVCRMKAIEMELQARPRGSHLALVLPVVELPLS
jgi:hypothetical protein